MDLRNLRTNPEKERGGVWKTYPGTDVRCLIARTRTSEYQAEARKIARQERSRADSLTGESILDAMAPTIAKLILLGWDGLTEGGAPLEYSEETAIRLLRDPQLADFRDWILGIASDADNYRDAAIESASGN